MVVSHELKGWTRCQAQPLQATCADSHVQPQEVLLEVPKSCMRGWAKSCAKTSVKQQPMQDKCEMTARKGSVITNAFEMISKT
jgi:hypothetical protein